MNSTRKRKKMRSMPYTRGQLNRLIDDLCHPFYKENQSLVLVDGVLHGLVERNPPKSVRKFLMFSLPGIIKQVLKQPE